MQFDTNTISADFSARRKITEALKGSFRRQNNGLYKFVHRGVVNWPTFDFTTHDVAVSISMSQLSIFRVSVGLSLNLEIDMFSALKSGSNELDDEIADNMIRDVSLVLLDLKKAVDTDGKPVILRLDHSSTQAVEIIDIEKQVQGLALTAPIEY